MRLTDDELTSLDSIQYPTAPPVASADTSSGGAWPSQHTTGPVWDSAEQAYYDQGASGLYSYDGGASWEPKRQQYDQPSVAQDNAYQQSQYNYAGDYNGTSVYTDPVSGNVWNNGNWYDNSGNIWSDAANSWLSPAQYQDFAQQSYDYANAQANPQFQPITYQQPGGDWYNYDNQQPNTYNLQDPRLGDYISQEPTGDWFGRFGNASGATGGLGGLIAPAASGFLNSPVGKAVGSIPAVTAFEAAVNKVNPWVDEATGTTRQQRINDQLSGNALVRDLTGGNVDLSQLPYGLGQVTDVGLAPATYIGLGATGGAKGTAWEAAKQIGSGAAGNLGAKFGASDTAASIPYFGDQPAWLRSLEAGSVAGIGAYGALDAAPGVAKSAGPILKDFNASETGEAFGTGIRRNVPEKTVIPDSSAYAFMQQSEQSAAVQRRMAAYREALASGDTATAERMKRELDNIFKNSPAEAKPGPEALANERLWFHSTRDMNYDLPDPDMAVGTQTGITQGPGVYMAADPAKSAGNYGNRTFVTEFDGKVLDLTKQVRETDPVFPGGPSWAKIRDDLAAKLEAEGIDATPVRLAFEPKALDGAQYAARADLAAVARNADGSYSANSYVYKQALIDATDRAVSSMPEVSVMDILNQRLAALDPKLRSGNMTESELQDAQKLTRLATRLEDGRISIKEASRDLFAKPLQGRFAAVDGEGVISHSVVQNHLADEGVDALFHHSPRADGDVLIVLNGKAARVVADVKNAPDAVKAGATLKDIKRGTVQKVVDTAAERRAARQGAFDDLYSVVQKEDWVSGQPDPNALEVRLKGTRETIGEVWKSPTDGTWSGRYDKGASGYGDSWISKDNFASKDEALNFIKQGLPGERANAIEGSGLRSFGAKLKDESGAVNIGDTLNAAKDVAKFAAPIATRTALGAGVGAAYGEASGMGWEKGAAIGGGVGLGFGVLGKVAGAAASRGVEARLAKQSRPEAAATLMDAVRKAVPVRESQQELYSQELGRRAGELAKVQARRGGEQGFYEGMGTLRGELPKATFTPPRPSLTPQDVTDLFNHVNDLGNMLPFTKMNTQAALVKVLAGELPTRSEITLLGKAFGEDFAKTLLAKRSLGAKVWETAVDALNLPRTLMTSWDASAPLRQGAILFAGHPIAGAKATGAMIRAMASPKYAELVQQGIENSPNATIYEKMGLYFADTTSSAALSAREEQIMSRLAAKIPGVGGSQRGYTTFLNKLRQDVADNFIAGHPNLSNQELKDFGHVINIMSGRGDLPRFLQDNSAILNAAFAPRYAMSRLQLPVEMVKAALPRALGGTSGAASKELARDVTAFVATGTTVLALGKLAGIWNVELDPRSTDFGKGKMGNTRFDFWAGEQQIARYAAQLIGDPTRGVDSLKTGQRKTSTGQIVDANRLDTIGRWLQTKKSPAVGLATDLLQGKDFVGQPLDLKTKEGIGNQAWQRLAPLFLQDMADAAKLSGNQWRALSAGPSAIGAGVQTYQDSDALKRQNWIRDNQGLFTGDLVQPGKTPDRYENLSPSGKQLVDAQYGTLKPFGQESKDAAAVREQAIADQSKDDTKRQMGDMTPEQWRKAYQARNEELAIRKDQIYAGLRASGKLSNNPDPVLDPYYKAIDASAAKNGGNPDWNEVDAYVAGLPESQQQYIAKNTGLVKIDTPPVQQFKQDYDAIKASGYFERTDKTWDAIKDSFGVSEPDYYKWKDQQVAQTLSMIGGTPEEPGKLAQAESIVAKMPAVKLMEEGVSNWKQQWAISNSDEAYLAWKYGYYEPTKEIKAYLSAKYER